MMLEKDNVSLQKFNNGEPIKKKDLLSKSYRKNVLNEITSVFEKAFDKIIENEENTESDEGKLLSN